MPLIYYLAYQEVLYAQKSIHPSCLKRSCTNLGASSQLEQIHCVNIREILQNMTRMVEVMKQANQIQAVPQKSGVFYFLLTSYICI